MPLVQIDDADDLTIHWRIGMPRARTWRCLTEAELLGQWLGELVSGAVGAGSSFVVDHGDGYCCRSTVTAWVEPSELDFTWHFPDEPPSTVALTLEAAGDGTELRLSHEDLGALAGSYVDGWCVHLSYLEAAALGAPLPRSMVWPLHGTVARLNARAHGLHEAEPPSSGI